MSTTTRLPTATDTLPRAERQQRTEDLLDRAATAEPAERDRLLCQVIELNIPVAASIASRYRTRGMAPEDLEQVANLALVKAAQGFDPSVGHSFLAYCVPCIRGAIKRHFRDHGWTVRPPRRIQELQASIWAAEESLGSALGRPPRPSDIAAELDVPLDDVLEALSTDGCYTPASLDSPTGDDESTALGDLIAQDDTAQRAAEARVLLAPVVRQLRERDRRILALRFFEGLTQQEIGEEIGVTQMQVSRLLSRIMEDLREELATPTSADSAKGLPPQTSRVAMTA